MHGVYQNKLIEIIDKNAPYINLSKKNKKKQSNIKLKPQITSSILKSIKTKKLYHKNSSRQKGFGVIHDLGLGTFFKWCSQ